MDDILKQLSEIKKDEYTDEAIRHFEILETQAKEALFKSEVISSPVIKQFVDLITQKLIFINRELLDNRELNQQQRDKMFDKNYIQLQDDCFNPK